MEAYRIIKEGGKFGLISLAPDIYKEFIYAFNRVAREHKHYFNDLSFQKLVGFNTYTSKKIVNMMEDIGFDVIKEFMLRLQEPITAEAYLKRIYAITNENYLDTVPTIKKTTIKENIKKTMLTKSGWKLKVSESNIFIIANKIGGKKNEI